MDFHSADILLRERFLLRAGRGEGGGERYATSRERFALHVRGRGALGGAQPRRFTILQTQTISRPVDPDFKSTCVLARRGSSHGLAVPEIRESRVAVTRFKAE
jgi:hypothetical protein